MRLLILAKRGRTAQSLIGHLWNQILSKQSASSKGADHLFKCRSATSDDRSSFAGPRLRFGQILQAFAVRMMTAQNLFKSMVPVALCGRERMSPVLFYIEFSFV